MKVTIIGCGNMGLIYARAFLKYSSQDLAGALSKLTEDDSQMVAGK